MAKIIQTEKLNAVIDMLIESDTDIPMYFYLTATIPSLSVVTLQC